MPLGNGVLNVVPTVSRATLDTHNQTMAKDLNTTAEVITTQEMPLLLTIPEAAAMLRVKERTWRTWLASGRIPEPIRIGRKVFWRPDDLKAWVAAGCPDRAKWEVLRK